MAFPAIYSFSMASLGFLWMFKTIDEVEDVSIERICSDTADMLCNISIFAQPIIANI